MFSNTKYVDQIVDVTDQASLLFGCFTIIWVISSPSFICTTCEFLAVVKKEKHTKILVEIFLIKDSVGK